MRMNRIPILAATLFLMLTAGIAQAQATRTWVSGVGDDMNPCSLTAPCKTWSGAFAKTAAGGEIDALNSGGYGTLLINKAITIDGGPGNIASTLTGTVTGMTISAAATDRVLLRNLAIQGAGVGPTGIKINSAKSVTIENVRIDGMGTGLARGIDAQCNSACRITVLHSTIDHNVGIGMVFQGTVANVIEATVVDSSATNSGSHGVFVANGADVTLTNVTSSENALSGLILDGNGTLVSAKRSTFVNNVGPGVQSGLGPAITGKIGLSRCIVTGNAPGVQFSGGAVESHLNNAIRRNSPDFGGVGALSPVSTQ
jgi:hypothetical protein